MFLGKAGPSVLFWGHARVSFDSLGVAVRLNCRNHCWDKMAGQESVIDLVRAAALTNHLLWSRAAFKWAYGRNLHVANHVPIMCQFIDDIMHGKIKRGLINMPPRMGKTELAVILLFSRIFAVNPLARNMHLSYSDGIVRKNSRRIKDLIFTRQFSTCFPELQISGNSYAQNHWETSEKGEFHAVAAKSQVTGFEAGMNGDPWDGILVLDDPQNAKRALSAADVSSSIDAVDNALNTRLNHENTPVLVIQQRLTNYDVSSWLMNGGTGDTWDVLCLQAISEGSPPKHYNEYSHIRLYDYDIKPGAIWPERRSIEWLHKIRDARDSNDEDNPRGALAFSAQYQQNPASSELSMLDKDWLNFYMPDQIPKLGTITVRVDTAMKGKDGSDHHGYVVFGHPEKDPSLLYVLDSYHKRCEFPELVDWIIELTDHLLDFEKTYNPRFTQIVIEDANIGAALQATLKVKFNQLNCRVGVVLTERYGNKFQRAMESVPFYQQGRVYLPQAHTPFIRDKSMYGIKQLLTEYKTFNEADTHASDDILDCLNWEIVTKFGKAKKKNAFVYRNIAT